VNVCELVTLDDCPYLEASVARPCSWPVNVLNADGMTSRSGIRVVKMVTDVSQD